MTVVSLASGSAGNAYLVSSAPDSVVRRSPAHAAPPVESRSPAHTAPPVESRPSAHTASPVVRRSPAHTLLIDCGLGPRELKSRLKSVGLADIAFSAVLVTHNHIDHISGLEAFHRHYPEVPIFANLMTAEAAAARVKMDEAAFTCFENGQDFEVGPFVIHPFSIPHDTCDPVGYLVRADGLTYFHGTDIGSPLPSIGLKLRAADVALLESNHDPVMLKASGRPAMLKQRISGPRGHLSNDQAADLVRGYASPRLKALALAHLSRECNVPRFAEDAMRAALADLKRADVALSILAQDEPKIVFGAREACPSGTGFSKPTTPRKDET